MREAHSRLYQEWICRIIQFLNKIISSIFSLFNYSSSIKEYILTYTFICDAMLGRLAKNLRFFGFDTIYVGDLEKNRRMNDPSIGERPLEDKEILEIAIQSGRTILTKDDQFAARDPVRVVLIDGKNVRDQFVFLKNYLGLSFNFDQANSRCYKCNEILEKVPKLSVEGRVNENTFVAFENFWECPICKKLYWKGSHFRQENGLLAKFDGLLDDTWELGDYSRTNFPLLVQSWTW